MTRWDLISRSAEIYYKNNNNKKLNTNKKYNKIKDTGIYILLLFFLFVE